MAASASLSGPLLKLALQMLLEACKTPLVVLSTPPASKVAAQEALGQSGKLRGLELFAGAGGLSLGLEQAGVDMKWAIEWEPDAAKSYQYVGLPPYFSRLIPGSTDIIIKILRSSMKASTHFWNGPSPLRPRKRSPPLPLEWAERIRDVSGLRCQDVTKSISYVVVSICALRSLHELDCL